MRYWVYHDSRVMGPFAREDLASVPGLSEDSLVCRADASGNRDDDWKMLGGVSELAELYMAPSGVPLAPAAESHGAAGGFADFRQGAHAAIDSIGLANAWVPGTFEDGGVFDPWSGVPGQYGVDAVLEAEKERAAELEERLSQLQAQLEEYQKRQDEILERLGEKDRLLADRDSSIEELRARLSGLEERGAARPPVPAAPPEDAAVLALRLRIAELEAQSVRPAAPVPPVPPHADPAVDALRARIAELEAAAPAPVASDSDALALEVLKARIAQLEGKAPAVESAAAPVPEAAVAEIVQEGIAVELPAAEEAPPMEAVPEESAPPLAQVSEPPVEEAMTPDIPELEAPAPEAAEVPPPADLAPPLEEPVAEESSGTESVPQTETLKSAATVGEGEDFVAPLPDDVDIPPHDAAEGAPPVLEAPPELAPPPLGAPVAEGAPPPLGAPVAEGAPPPLEPLSAPAGQPLEGMQLTPAPAAITAVGSDQAVPSLGAPPAMNVEAPPPMPAASPAAGAPEIPSITQPIEPGPVAQPKTMMFNNPMAGEQTGAIGAAAPGMDAMPGVTGTPVPIPLGGTTPVPPEGATPVPPEGATPIPLGGTPMPGQAATPMPLPGQTPTPMPAMGQPDIPHTVLEGMGVGSTTTPMPGGLQTPGSSQSFEDLLGKPATVSVGQTQSPKTGAPVPLTSMTGKGKAGAAQPAGRPGGKRSIKPLLIKVGIGAGIIATMGGLFVAFFRNPKQVQKMVDMSPEPKAQGTLSVGGAPGAVGGSGAAGAGTAASSGIPQRPSAGGAPSVAGSFPSQPQTAPPQPAAPPPAVPPAQGRDFIEDKQVQAMEFVKNYDLGSARGTISAWLDYSFPPPAMPEWSAGAIQAQVWLVEYLVFSGPRAKKPRVTYSFEVDLARGTLAGRNKSTKHLLSGGTSRRKPRARAARRSRRGGSGQLPLPDEDELEGASSAPPGGFNNPGG